MKEAGVSNVEADVADGEALVAFADESVDAVTCTWGLMFMPEWQKAVKVGGRARHLHACTHDGRCFCFFWCAP